MLYNARAIFTTLVTPKTVVNVYRDEEFYFHDTVFQVCITITPPTDRAISVEPALWEMADVNADITNDSVT